MKIKVFKLKQGKESQWKKWCKQLQTTHRKEALSTIREECGTFESFILYKVGNEYYTIGISDTQIPANKNSSLNKEHQKQKRECLEYFLDTEVLYELNTKDKDYII